LFALGPLGCVFTNVPLEEFRGAVIVDIGTSLGDGGSTLGAGTDRTSLTGLLAVVLDIRVSLALVDQFLVGAVSRVEVVFAGSRGRTLALATGLGTPGLEPGLGTHVELFQEVGAVGLVVDTRLDFFGVWLSHAGVARIHGTSATGLLANVLGILTGFAVAPSLVIKTLGLGSVVFTRDFRVRTATVTASLPALALPPSIFAHVPVLRVGLTVISQVNTFRFGGNILLFCCFFGVSLRFRLSAALGASPARTDITGITGLLADVSDPGVFSTFTVAVVVGALLLIHVVDTPVVVGTTTLTTSFLALAVPKCVFAHIPVLEFLGTAWADVTARPNGSSEQGT
jgi:hypothetical protein